MNGTYSEHASCAIARSQIEARSHEESALTVIITRASGLQTIFNTLGKGSSYGNSTTHLEKLLPRIVGGGGGGCPVVAIAIKTEAYVDDGQAQ
jgi:hypothetical protein